MHNLKYFVYIGVILLTACTEDEAQRSRTIGVFTYQDEQTAVMNGVIGSRTPEDWDDYMQTHPSTTKLIMKNCPGSEDDTANLRVAQKVYQQGISIHLPADAHIASGAVDFYLAGETRTREIGSKIGVHSWSDEQSQATDYEEGHPKHLPYIDYYMEVGFSEEDAEEFYYFTIYAASSESIYYMTDDEIREYKLVTD